MNTKEQNKSITIELKSKQNLDDLVDKIIGDLNILLTCRKKYRGKDVKILLFDKEFFICYNANTIKKYGDNN